MKLTDLKAQFVRYSTTDETVTVIDGDPVTWKSGGPTKDVVRPVEHKIFVDSLAEAQGIWMLCPLCFKTNSGPKGTHMVEVTFADRGVNDNEGTHNMEGHPVRWQVSGTGLNDLTTSPSIQLLGGGCAWHGFIKDGDAA